MKQFFLAFFSLVSSVAFAQDVINDPQAQKRTLNAEFNAIQVSDGIKLYLNQGGEESIAVSSSNAEYLDRFKTEVENGVLKIYFDTKGFNWNVGNKRKLTAYVSFKNLSKLKATSGSNVEVKGTIAVPNLEIDLSSGAHINGMVDVQQLSIDESSGAGAELSGTVKEFKIDASSGSLFRGYELTTETCQAKASSGAGVRITVSKELMAKANSGGGIHYRGEASIKDIDVSSGGIVKKG